MTTSTDSVTEMQEALGWAPTPGTEEQAAYQRVGGNMVPDVPAPVADAPAPAPVTDAPPAPPAPPAPGDIGAPPAPADAAKADAELVTQANRDATAYKVQLLTAGWDDNSAHTAASQYARAQYQDAKNRSLMDQQEQQAQSQVATKIGQDHGIDPALIAHYPTPAAMKAAAEHFKAQGVRLTALEGSPTPKTPTQNFDSQNGGGMSQQQRKIAYATGQINLTTKEYKELYNR